MKLATASRIDVGLGDRSYPILVEAGLLGRAGTLLKPYARDDRLVVVTDEHVWAAQGGPFSAALAASRLRFDTVILPPGEETKGWTHLGGLVDRLIALGVERDDAIVAFGGGVVGDLTGFAAAIFKRGCRWLQVPTTLLAQADSSVGGKTAINVPGGKNLVGAFHQPATVLIDPGCLSTLPLRQIRAGYAEIVKYGLIGNAGFFAWCEQNGRSVIAGDPEARTFAIASAVRMKAAIVAEDERDMEGRRALLNLGHTFAHALEAETGFSHRLLHGEAVALGMVLALRFSAERGLCCEADATRVAAHLDAVGLPVSLPAARVDASGAALAAHMLNDKKASGGRQAFVLVHGIGEAFLDRSVALDDVADFLERQRAPVRA